MADLTSDDDDVGIDVTWHDTLAVVGRGANLVGRLPPAARMPVARIALPVAGGGRLRCQSCSGASAS
ncbi:hypothetical protein ACIRVF_33085 [Kitasatospora sp. NPDC101157]|uniref:hypothetical protein n=1 Tax=Kitasatospora sp. NPDC101157 TaxID=3364098 RepID=UPI0038081DA4